MKKSFVEKNECLPHSGAWSLINKNILDHYLLFMLRTNMWKGCIWTVLISECDIFFCAYIPCGLLYPVPCPQPLRSLPKKPIKWHIPLARGTLFLEPHKELCCGRVRVNQYAPTCCLFLHGSQKLSTFFPSHSKLGQAEPNWADRWEMPPNGLISSRVHVLKQLNDERAMWKPLESWVLFYKTMKLNVDLWYKMPSIVGPVHNL